MSSLAPCAVTIDHINHFSCLYQLNKSEIKMKLRQAGNHCKRILEAPKFAYDNKTKDSA